MIYSLIMVIFSLTSPLPLVSVSFYVQKMKNVQLWEQSQVTALEKQIWIDLVYTRSMKIVRYTNEPRLKASPRHGGRVFFFEFLVTDPPLGSPVGGGGIHRN